VDPVVDEQLALFVVRFLFFSIFSALKRPCIYTHIFYMYICMYIQVNSHIRSHPDKQDREEEEEEEVNTYKYVYIYLYISTYTYIYIFVYIYIYIYIHIIYLSRRRMQPMA
jgi:hypothetical protein